MIDLLIENFQKEAAKGRLRAAGICYDVLAIPPGKGQKQDAICCGREHCLGEAVDVFIPYAKAANGKGACAVDAPVDCGAYECGATECLTECKSDTDCIVPNRCTNQKCGSGARCSDDLTSVVDADSNATACAPCLCQGEACLIACSSTTDCADGYVCNAQNQQCEAVTPNSATDAGCGCRAAGRSRHGGTAQLLCLALLLLLLMISRVNTGAGVPAVMPIVWPPLPVKVATPLPEPNVMAVPAGEVTVRLPL